MNLDGRPTTMPPPSGPADGRRVRHHSAARSSTRARRILLALAIGAATVAVPRLIVPLPQQGTATTGAPAPSSKAPSTGESALLDLLSRDRPVTASSTEYDVTPAAAAVDGLPDTRWSSAFADPQWLRVDLGAVATISRVVLRWESAYAKAYHIQTSNDGATWTSIYSTGTSAGGAQTLDVTGSGRYVRMYGTARSGQYGYSLWEFEVYGTTDNAGCDTARNSALNRPATASSLESAGHAASNAVDGRANTRWSSAFADPQWIQVDLGSSQNVCEVVLAWETAHAKAYQVEVSADGTTWTQIYSAQSPGGHTETLTLFGTGRYLRVYGTARATSWGYSLWELTVHTRAAAPGMPSTAPPSTPSQTSSASALPLSAPPPGAGDDVLLSYQKPGVASSSQDDPTCRGCGPSLALDHDQNTRWATSATTGWVDPGWIQVDLGAAANVRKVVLQWEAAYATAYQIQVSPDAATWTTIYSTSTGHGLRETLTVNGTGRYVRMFGTARSNGYGYSLWEFEVYGTGGDPIAPPPPPPPPAGVTFPATHLVFSDEFDGPAGTKPDPAKWKADTGIGPNNELEYYTDNRNAATDGAGNLVLEARREVTPGSACPGGPCQFTSARLNTSNSFTFTYGHVEARIKVSGTQGLWPAFWMIGSNFPTVGWPQCGEIDIMEHVGKEPTKVFSNLHAPAYHGGNGIGSPYAIGADFAADVHTFAVDWSPTYMTFYVDGNAFFTADKAQVEATRGPWVFDHPFYLVLNNAVGGDWPGSPDGTSVFPQRMLVDYVRVYQ